MSILQVYSSIPLLTSILGKLETNISSSSSSSSSSKAVSATRREGGRGGVLIQEKKKVQKILLPFKSVLSLNSIYDNLLFFIKMYASNKNWK